MTIIAALRDGDTVWIGADSRITDSHGLIVSGDHRKWRHISDMFWLGSAGHVRLDAVIGQMKLPSDRHSAYGFAQYLYAAVSDDGWIPEDTKDGGPRQFCYDCIGIDPGGIWLLHGSGVAISTGGEFVAVGSGAPYAYGAAFALSHKSAMDVVTGAVSAAYQYDRDCGGKMLVEQIRIGT